MSKDQYVAEILDCLEALDQDAFSAFLTLSIDRKNTPTEALEVIHLAVKYQHRGVVGVDLCGDPSRPCDVSNFAEAFAMAKDRGLGITLHFAEVIASSTESELQTLLSFKPDRIGHVIHVNDSMKESIAQNNICLELCLSCNVHAKLIDGGFDTHHFNEWWQRKGRGPIALGVSRPPSCDSAR